MKIKLFSLIVSFWIFLLTFVTCFGAAEAIKVGDTNRDTEINTKDAVLLAQRLAKWSVVIDETAADCNGDRELSAKDAVLLSQFLAKWNVSLYDPTPSSVDILTVAGKDYYLGMDAKNIGSPDEKLRSTRGFEWYVFGTGTYIDFFAAGVSNGRVVSLVSCGKGFSYGGYKCGDITNDSNDFTKKLYKDKNDNNKVHAVSISDSSYRFTVDPSALDGESKMNFHFTNAFRVYHGLKKLTWSDKAAKAAYLHSQDMADQNYFDHDSLDGTRFSARLSLQGISWRSCAENIAAGTVRYTGLENYNAWVNSSGHRNNILSDRDFLGVGAAYNASSDYKYYFTQDFYK